VSLIYGQRDFRGALIVGWNWVVCIEVYLKRKNLQTCKLGFIMCRFFLDIMNGFNGPNSLLSQVVIVESSSKVLGSLSACAGLKSESGPAALLRKVNVNAH